MQHASLDSAPVARRRLEGPFHACSLVRCWPWSGSGPSSPRCSGRPTALCRGRRQARPRRRGRLQEVPPQAASSWKKTGDGQDVREPEARRRRREEDGGRPRPEGRLHEGPEVPQVPHDGLRHRDRATRRAGRGRRLHARRGGARDEDRRASTCEACHGPGSLYSPYKKDHPDFKLADIEKLGATTPPKAESCMACHVKECPTMPKDYAFDFEKAKKSRRTCTSTCRSSIRTSAADGAGRRPPCSRSSSGGSRAAWGEVVGRLRPVGMRVLTCMSDGPRMGGGAAGSVRPAPERAGSSGRSAAPGGAAGPGGAASPCRPLSPGAEGGTAAVVSRSRAARARRAAPRPPRPPHLPHRLPMRSSRLPAPRP